MRRRKSSGKKGPAVHHRRPFCRKTDQFGEDKLGNIRNRLEQAPRLDHKPADRVRIHTGRYNALLSVNKKKT